MEQVLDFQARKAALRKEAQDLRRAQPDKDALSQRICRAAAALPEYAAAGTVFYSLDVRDEVRTRDAIRAALAGGKRVIVPYCVDRDLHLFHLESMEELSLGAYEILEPREELRRLPAKRVSIDQVDLILAPGVAFDRTGARLGHGFGYYDKLLQRARPDAPLIGLAFECQLFPDIPTEPHDIFMDKIVTERTVYTGQGRGEQSPCGNVNPVRQS